MKPAAYRKLLHSVNLEPGAFSHKYFYLVLVLYAYVIDPVHRRIYLFCLGCHLLYTFPYLYRYPFKLALLFQGVANRSLLIRYGLHSIAYCIKVQ
jgi:hypothetical protein